MQVVGLVRDLFFRSKIDAVAGSLGIEVEYTSTLELFLDRITHHAPRLIFVDLSEARFDADAIAQVARSRAPEARLVGFASHVDLRALAGAREAGFERVLSRQEFTAKLASLLESAKS